MTLDLAPIADELPRLAAKKGDRLMIGFAAETEDLEVNALDKLRRKKLDLIVGNDVSRSDAGFGVDTNIVTMLGADGHVETTPKLLKDEVARRDSRSHSRDPIDGAEIRRLCTQPAKSLFRLCRC